MSFTLSAGLMASNYAGNTKKSTANGLIFAGWAAGLIAGPRKSRRQLIPIPGGNWARLTCAPQNSSSRARRRTTSWLSAC